MGPGEGCGRVVGEGCGRVRGGAGRGVWQGGRVVGEGRGWVWACGVWQGGESEGGAENGRGAGLVSHDADPC